MPKPLESTNRTEGKPRCFEASVKKTNNQNKRVENNGATAGNVSCNNFINQAMKRTWFNFFFSSVCFFSVGKQFERTVIQRASTKASNYWRALLEIAARLILRGYLNKKSNKQMKRQKKTSEQPLEKFCVVNLSTNHCKKLIVQLVGAQYAHSKRPI